MNSSDEFFNDMPKLRVVREGFPTTKSLRNRARSLTSEKLQANTSWNEMLQASSPVLSSTSWSEAAGEDLDRGGTQSRTQSLLRSRFQRLAKHHGSNRE